MVWVFYCVLFSPKVSTFHSFLFFILFRLTPSYMFAILFLTKLRPFFGDGPRWFMGRDTSTCSDYWWTNLLYINNIYPKSFKVFFNPSLCISIHLFTVESKTSIHRFGADITIHSSIDRTIDTCIPPNIIRDALFCSFCNWSAYTYPIPLQIIN